MKKIINKIDKAYIVKILILAISFSILYNFIREDGIPLIRKKEIINYIDDELLESNVVSKNDSLKYISYNQLNKLLTGARPVIIDARDPWEFNEGHIPGALNIPGYNVEAYDKKLNSLDKGKKIIVYCSEQDCNLSKNVAEYLLKLGYEDVFVFLEGWEKWNNEGGIIEKGNNDEIISE